MQIRDELKDTDIKYCMCYQFIMFNSIDINFSDILLDEKLNQNISVYGISCKTSKDSKPLRIRFNKVDGFIMILVSKKVV